MPVFISYSHKDKGFVDELAANLVLERHNVWLDRWELNVGDSIIDRIQRALTESSAMLVILSKNSVESEWCKKELNAGIIRELDEKKVIVLPCVIDDCEVPLFLREKMRANFNDDPDAAFTQVNDALLRISNRQQGRLESPEVFTDWSFDWKKNREDGRWMLEWTFVDHSDAIEYCMLTRCGVFLNEQANSIYEELSQEKRQSYARNVFAHITTEVVESKTKLQLSDAFERFFKMQISPGVAKQRWFVEVSSRRMGVDNGKDTLVHIDQLFERTLGQMTREEKATAAAQGRAQVEAKEGAVNAEGP
jgi:hypothetical protein